MMTLSAVQMLFVVLLLLASLGALPHCVAAQTFRKINEIKLSEDILIGTISSIDRNDAGYFLIVDRIGKNVVLFDAQGQVLTTLSAEACDPGAILSPSKAYFLPDGSIFVINANPPWGLIFTAEGHCQRKAHKSFSSSKGFCATRTRMFGLQTIDPDDPKLLDLFIEQYDYQGKSLGTFADVSDEFSHINRRSDYSGLVCGGDGTVYLALASGPELYKYDASGQLVATFRHVPSYHQTVNEDIPFTSDIRQLIKAFKKINEEKTLTFSILSLDEHRIMMQFMTGKPYGVQIIDTRNGALVHENEIRTERLFLFAQDGLAYGFIPSTLNEEGELPNPSIAIYELVDSE